jgi:alcohol dehydrogenase
MKAAQINKYGGGEAVEINNSAPVPAVAEGKVLVEIYAAGVNPIDWKMREGYVKDRAPLDFPITIGGDFAGVIKEVGEGVSNFKVGDEIYGQAGLLNNGSGSFAEMAVADIQKVALRPQTLTYIETAGLPLAGVSAWQGITEHIQAAPVKKVLIHGGAGGIGAAGIQIAKHFGAYVAATARLLITSRSVLKI